MGLMSGRHGRLLVPILGGLAAVGLAAAGFGLVTRAQEHSIRLAKEHELASIIQERDALQVQIASLETEKSKIEQELGEAKSELDQSKQQFTKVQQEQQSLSTNLEQRQGELSKLTQAMDSMMKELSQARSDREKLNTQLSKLSTERDTLQQQLDETKKAQRTLEAKLSEFSRVPTVQLEKVMVSTSEQERPPMPIPIQPIGAVTSAIHTGSNGQVLVINRDYDFVVVDMGKNQGLSVGQQFKVVRGDEVIGTVKVEKVYDDLSAAAILSDTKADLIREGDQVRSL